MKFIFLTDTHITDKMNSRLDNYAETILAKWNAIIRYARKNKIDTIVHGGDIFDKSIISRSLEQRFYQFYTAEANKIPHYLLHGTHDYGSGSPTLEAKSLWYVNNLQEKEYNVHFTNGVATIPITRYSRMHDMDMPDGTLALLTPYADIHATNATIIIVHQMLTDGPMPFDHIDINTLNITPRICLSGDYHPGFAPKLVNGTWFANPGALARTFRSKEDLTRVPQFAIIDTDLLPACPITYVPISEVYPDYKSSEEVCVKLTEPAITQAELATRRKHLQATVSSAVDHARSYNITTWQERLAKIAEDVELGAILSASDLDMAAGVERLRKLCEDRDLDV